MSRFGSIVVVMLLASACARPQSGGPGSAPAGGQADFSGDRALETVAFMDHYFRLPGNAGFDASIRRVEGILKDAGYVEESAAPAGARLTYRIEKRPLRPQ